MQTNQEYLQDVLEKALKKKIIKKEEIKDIETRLNEITKYHYDFKKLYQTKKNKQTETETETETKTETETETEI